MNSGIWRIILGLFLFAGLARGEEPPATPPSDGSVDQPGNPGDAVQTGTATLAAQGMVGLHENFLQRINASKDIAPLGNDVFGDQISLKTGSVEFNVVDIEVPGNDALPVQLARQFRVEDRLHGGGSLGGFDLWDLDIPYLKGTFSAGGGWLGGAASTGSRCSQPAPPQTANGFAAHEFWDGNWLHVPGAGDQALLGSPDASLPSPTGSTAYPWITKTFWRVSCKATTKNGYPGEAFVALSPEGVKYTFDWVVTRSVATTLKGWTTGTHSSTLDREVIYFLVTRIQDRFGNHVDYAYSGDQLAGITSSDGRQITVASRSAAGNITSVTSSVGTWNYSYAANSATVTRPDGSQWKYAWTGQLAVYPAEPLTSYDPTNNCPMPDLSTGEFTYTVTSPSGAKADFSFMADRHFRHNIPKLCNTFPNGMAALSNYHYLTIPNFSDTLTLVSKQISGPGLATMAWSYTYDIGASAMAFADVCTPQAVLRCAQTVATEVVGPGPLFQRYHFGAWYNVNEGQLLKVETGQDAANIVRTQTYEFLDTAAVASQPFPDAAGNDMRANSDDLNAAWLRPMKQSTATQDGVSFQYVVNVFDGWARATNVRKFSSLGYSRTEGTAYWDDLGKWVLGQVTTVTCTLAAPVNCPTGMVMSRTDYDANAMPWRLYGPGTQTVPGKLLQTLTYNANGTLATVKDGRNNITIPSNWKRGIPQTIRYPATPEAPTGATQIAVVNDSGWITAVTDENGYRTCYTHDPMGRVASVVLPSATVSGTCDTTAWNPTTQTFAPFNTGAEYGIPAGHWKQTVSTGNARKITYFDALWRPLVQERYDTANATGTRSISVKRYDLSGHPAYQSYALGTLTDYAAVTQGTRTFHDALDRVTQVDQDSELGVLTSTTVYQTGFKAQFTNPRGFKTTTSYMAYDQPTTDWPIAIVHPEGAYTDIARDAFGKPTSLTRRNVTGSVGNLLTRDYVYNVHQELCKTTEPETNATLMGYDPAGNLAWSAMGLPVGTACDATGTSGPVVARKASRSYDARNRNIALSFPDGEGNTRSTYTPDGQLATIVADNNGGIDQVTTAYTYDTRRQPISENMQWGGLDWFIYYTYDANGSLASKKSNNLTVSFSPNALGQPTKAGTFATGVSYFPNGAIKQFTYGNGIVHTLVQNTRQLPDRSKDVYGASTAVLDDGYDFDENGNVAAISDGLPDAPGERTMTYDGLDRLKTTVSPMYGTDGASYTYDVLDNLKTVKAPGRDHTYIYDPQFHLTNVMSGGASVIGLGYGDLQGNVTNKNGTSYTFDYGNRLRRAITVSPATTTTYVYDGHGRRVGDITGAAKYSLYSMTGELTYARDMRLNKRYDYVSLAGSLVAIRTQDVASGVFSTSYQHTDALGSPVAVTNASRVVIEHNEYEPYGKLLNEPLKDGPGYTGHVSDAATGLSYMQQRYYDPGIGRFLSVDPVTADGNSGGNFNRYWYANNNPYKFTDPDGRESACFATGTGCGINAPTVADQVAFEDAVFDTAKAAGNLFLSQFGDAPGVGLAAAPVGLAKGVAQELGVVYKRINPHTLEGYIGKAKSFARYLARQGEHNSALGVKHEYEVLGRAAGKDLSHLEESQIRSQGGLQKEGGQLANKIHAVSQKKFDGFQGTFRVEGRLDARRLDKELSGK